MTKKMEIEKLYMTKIGKKEQKRNRNMEIIIIIITGTKIQNR
jgi:hypothetical protein